MKEKVADVLVKALKDYGSEIPKEEILSNIEIPPSVDKGDYAFPCFAISRKTKENPHFVALDIRKNIGTPKTTDFEDIQVQGGYINFFLNRKALAQKVIYDIISKRKKYGTKRSFPGFRKKIVIEYSSPNIAKPFGIGHLRSTIIGNAISNICETQGYKPIRINFPGDWGTQFGKLLLAFKKWGDTKKLEKDPIKYLERLYVRINNHPELEDESREWFKKLENGEKDAINNWRAFRELSLEEFKKIYNLLGMKFDYVSGESNHVNYSKKIIEQLKEKKLVKKNQEAYVIDLSKHGLGVVLIEKKDGTTLYITRDIAAAIKRYKKYKFEKMIYQVGNEQALHFKQLFKILELIGYDWSKKCVHSPHGLYLDTDKKKFSTRKGKTVYVEDLINETKEAAKKEIQSRVSSRITKTELEERAHKVAIAAIFYGDLKNTKNNNIVFDPKKFVSFEGDTGPYIQYSYARASSILRKTTNKEPISINELKEKEIELVKKLYQYPEVLEKAFENLSPSFIATYVFNLSKTFNEFYHECPVIGDENESFRLGLVEAFRQVTRNSFSILGIEVLEEM